MPQKINIEPNYDQLVDTFLHEATGRIKALSEKGRKYTRKEIYPLVHAINMVFQCSTNTQAILKCREAFDKAMTEMFEKVQQDTDYDDEG